ncbi:hypothetical protein SUGI_1357760 [Cryptomeria japonica]|uniref:Xyloglucan endotransglucosylase/hydrolase n=1 Tax=Cryptomeria japonica TaxID=3369 RepID=A0AAD3NPX9_CRYJA|nr:hypothetical protein SUGI_1357620 [Cryptomeria japonica]GLJ57649.1 hypothetical protein SUGI_1357690 [Cryptomeria japonica]GLJ57655.1 hypothetical protein SUGI_1357760 [Cryptomeria japonica]
MDLILCALLLSLALAFSHLVSANFYNDFDITWGNDQAKILDNSQRLQLTLDQSSGSGFQSKNEYLFGKIDMQIKLVPGNSAGTVTAYYLSSQGDKHDEIDFEFLGNLNSTFGSTQQQTSTLTPCSGIPNKLCFLWMELHLWNADNWATRGGAVKIDWSKSPFVASYGNFKAETCSASSDCSVNSWYGAEALESSEQQKLEWVRENYMIYNYCSDSKRFPQGLPAECTR